MPKRYRPTYREIVGKNIARARGEMTAVELGAAMRLHFPGQWGKQTMSALENGKRPIEISELVMIALILETDLPSLTTPVWDDKAMRDAAYVRFGSKVRPVRDLKSDPTVRVDRIRKVVAPPESSRLADLRSRVVAVLDETIGARTKMTPRIETKRIPGPNSGKEG